MQRNFSLLQTALLLVPLIFLNHVTYAQNDLRPVTSKYAITNATIVKAPGQVIEKGTILFEDGIIKSIGSNVSVPADAWVIKADSMYVYAGFISGMSHIGLDKPEESKRDDDRKLTGNPSYERAGITPQKSAYDVLNPKNAEIKDFRSIGFTAALAVPQKGMLAGQGTLIMLGGNSKDELVFQNNTAMFSQFSGANGVYPNTVIGVMAKYRDLYRKSDQSQQYLKKYQVDPVGMERPYGDETLTALFPVINKQMPVAFKAEGIRDIFRVLDLQKDLDFNLMIGEVKQGWDAIGQLKSSGASIFLSLDLPELKEKEEDNGDEETVDDGTTTLEKVEQHALEARQREMIKNYYTQGSKMIANGISFGFSTLEVKGKDVQRTLQGLLQNGLSEDQLLAALTTNPASLLGVSSSMGTLDQGKIANLFITDKPYFEEESKVKMVFVNGVKYENQVKDKKKKKGTGEDIDPKGKWSYTYSAPQGEQSGTFKIEGSDGNYSGEIYINYIGQDVAFSSVLVDGNLMTMTADIDAGGNNLTIEINLTVDGDTGEGSLSAGQFGTFEMEATKEPN